MVVNSKALTIWLLSLGETLYIAESFRPLSIPGGQPVTPSLSKQRTLLLRPLSASVDSSFDANNGDIGDEWKQNVESITSAYSYSLPRPSIDYDDQDEEFDVPYAPKTMARLSANSYTVDLPITATVDLPVGMSLRQVGRGNKISDVALSVDSLTLMDANESITKTSVANTQMTEDKNNAQILDEDTLTNLFENNFGPNFEGVIVSEVIENGLAWNAGVRLGDVLVATSATLGDNMWPKTTLEGVRSAFRSRKVMSQSMAIQFRRCRAYLEATEVIEKFNLVLTRPMGIEVEEQEDGSIQITGFTSDAEKSIVKDTLRIGDRIVAVDSTIGEKMWPVSSVEGLVSACTTRLPGQPVRLQFERTVNVGEFKTDVITDNKTKLQSTAVATADGLTNSLGGAVDGFRTLKDASSTAMEKGAPISIQTSGSNTHKLLLSRSRDLLRRYMKIHSGVETRSALNALPSIVADRVLEALADASAPLDAKTLNLVMNAYSSCRLADKAIDAFEAVVGISADGSSSKPTTAIAGKRDGNFVVADINALDLYTATSLLRAFALKGDHNSARRVLAAMEGRAGVSIDNKASISWPINEATDVRCYNVVLSAAAKAGGKDGINAAIEIFDSMDSPTRGVIATGMEGNVIKNIISYNTLIGAFAKLNRSQDALTLFYDMKQVGIKPDKVTYTSLLKALIGDGDLIGGEELLQEMREIGIEPDVVTYNTMIKGYCDGRQWFKAKKLVTEMEASGINPNSLTYGLLMNGLLKVDKPGACLTLFEAAYADERTMALTENVQLYTTAITAASRLGNYERAIDLVSRMKKAGVKPNIKTLTSLMSACLYANQTQQALDVYGQTVKIAEESDSIELDGSILSLAVKAFCDNNDFISASKLLTEQKDGYQDMSGKEIMQCYDYIIHKSLKQNEYEIARSAMTELLLSGYIPSKAIFENVVKALNIDVSSRKNRREKVQFGKSKDRDTKKLQFMLFVLDSISARKLPVGGMFYSAILMEGVRIGGVGRKIATIMGKARAHTKEFGGTSYDSSETSETKEQNWETLLQLFENDEVEKNEDSSSNPPFLRVRVGKKEARQVMEAEGPVFKSKKVPKVQRRVILRQSRAR